jgi:hypothetical protein
LGIAITFRSTAGSRHEWGQNHDGRWSADLEGTGVGMSARANVETVEFQAVFD